MSTPKKNSERPSTPSSQETSNVEQKKSSSRLWWVVGSASIVLVAVALVTGWAYVSQNQTIVKNTTVLGADLGGLTAAQALEKIQTSWDAYRAKPLDVSFGTKTISIVLQGAGSIEDDSFVLDIASVDAVQAANAAFAFGHEGSILDQIRLRASGWIGRRHELGKISFASDALEDILRSEGTALEVPAKNARLSFSGTTPTILPSETGSGFDYPAAVKIASTTVRNGSHATIVVPTTKLQPTIPSSSSLTASLTNGSIEDALQHFPFTVTYSGKTWTITAEQGKKLLGFIPGTTVRIGFDTTSTAAYLKAIATDVAVAAVEPKLVLENGKVTAFASGTVGRSLNSDKTITAMNDALVTQKATAVAVVDEIQPSTSTADTNALGITELVAEATTDFKGSPSNRRYNLGFGAKKLNGLLIKPGETLSLVSTLGKIDGAHGWKPELVIKGSKITPEFGGGLCQVATTLFRSALNAGLPIVERTNHSLRISYYEPPVGLDATIYEPRPDLKFTNNYSTPLLIQTEVKGTKLIFRLYGTKDGRTVSIPTPTVYNKVGIPATKYIQVDTLKPGEQKCQKPGHPGADAIATYTVTYADGTKKVQTFKSHYRAIGVICQVGKAAATTTNTNSGS